MPIDSFLDAAQSLLSPQAAAIVFLAVIIVGIGVGVVMSFRGTGPSQELRDWLSVDRIGRAHDETLGTKLAPGDAERLRAAILDEGTGSRRIHDSNPIAGIDGAAAQAGGEAPPTALPTALPTTPQSAPGLAGQAGAVGLPNRHWTLASTGAVTHLAEVDRRAVASVTSPLEWTPWNDILREDPLRRGDTMPADPGADLAWADGALALRGIVRSGAPEQVRTWSLSSVWRLPTGEGSAWLKVVPKAWGNEGGLLDRLSGEAVPRLLGRDRERLLLADVPGEDQDHARLPQLLEMVDILVELQRRWAGRVDQLSELGLPDWRAPALSGAIADVVERTRSALRPSHRVELTAFVARLSDRFAAIEECGLPEGLIHGDFHPGNVRGGPGQLILLDWGDSGISHPLLDQPGFLARIDQGDVEMVRDHWHAIWRQAVPGCDPDQAARLLAPVAAARQAVIYRRFLDYIEVPEHAYHRADVLEWLARTAALLRDERRNAARG